MGIQYQHDSPYAKAMAAWEMDHSPYGPPGRQRVFTEFPKMLYRTAPNADSPKMETFIVGDADEERNMQSRGWCLSQQEALDARDQALQAKAIAAAERVYHERGMSEKAKAEAAAHDDATDQHLAEIPETPIRRSHKKAVA